MGEWESGGCCVGLQAVVSGRVGGVLCVTAGCGEWESGGVLCGTAGCGEWESWGCCVQRSK